jgi:hypothetical protein
VLEADVFAEVLSQGRQPMIGYRTGLVILFGAATLCFLAHSLHQVLFLCPRAFYCRADCVKEMGFAGANTARM